MNKKIGLVSLGCSKNRVDSEMVLGELDIKGYELTPQEEEADILIVNTCGFIESAKAESIETIIEMAGHKKTGNCKQLIVMGCLSQRYRDEILTEIPEIDYLVGAGDVLKVTEIIESSNPQKSQVREPTFHYSQNRILTTPSHYAYLKISEGCSSRCSFCIIPRLRGPFKSRPIDSIVSEAQSLAERGVKELILISQDTTMYGSDLGIKKGLSLLLKKLTSIDKIQWVRLLYCHPSLIDNGFVEIMRDEEKVCSYLDIPIQHSHNDILKAMRRNETESNIRNLIEKIRKNIPGVAIRTTFIVGFPGETDRHFESLTGFVEEQRFEHAGVFTYSCEEGTESASLPDQLPEEIKNERLEKVMAIQKEISLQHNLNAVGTVRDVLVDDNNERDFLITGRMRTQAPEVDGVVILEESEVKRGEIVKVKITRGMEYDLVGQVL